MTDCSAVIELISAVDKERPFLVFRVFAAISGILLFTATVYVQVNIKLLIINIYLILK
jgi:hypothetical protein